MWRLQYRRYPDFRKIDRSFPEAPIKRGVKTIHDDSKGICGISWSIKTQD
jgi:hypothetical protein